jgi:predicted nuclease of predicted toxin-antitoxin system
MLREITLVADESVDFGIISTLRQKGIVVISILENYPGIKDTEVLKLAHDQRYLLITEDKDFGELTFRLKLKHDGIMLIRLNDMPRKERIQFVAEIMEKYFDKMKSNFSVLTTRGLRIKTTKKTP